MAHALLSAVEFAATGKDPITGAIAGVTGEATAQYLTKALYNKTPNELTASEKENISTLSQLAGGLAGAFTAKTTGNTPQQGGSFLSAVAGAETAKRAVENNYLSEEQQKTFEKELIECKSQKRDCSDVIKKYLDISNKSSRALYKNCKDGGVRCAGKEEIIDVSTNISRAKYDTSGRIFIGTALQDDDAIRIINYLNERDLSYLKEKVSNTDRLIYQSLDISNWPAILFGMRNLLTNNSKVAFSSGAISMGANAAIQYSFNKDIDINDVITAGLLGKATAGRSYINTINSNMISSYYISRIKGENDAAYSALSSYFSSMAGYRIGGRVENKINPFFNPAKDKYKWIESNHLGVSFQPKPSTIPSTTGNVFNSLSSELFNNKLTEGKE
ncbi:VENN motif pre-toxin domain-containing protein [Avibacterium avium]|uniref:VENN motif pre-toxin domain-containing protein n=2 Tax=Avibacterium avium TaxID=751 RepID=UPI003BF831CE